MTKMCDKFNLLVRSVRFDLLSTFFEVYNAFASEAIANQRKEN